MSAAKGRPSAPAKLFKQGLNMADGTQAAGARSRPLSPHLQIWRWTVTMAASITHRATGIALYAGAGLLALWFFAAASGPEMFAPVGGLLASPVGLVVLFGFCWALLFHAMNGVRHLYWDSGRGLAPKDARITAWFIYAASLLTAAAVFAFALGRG